MPSPRLVKRILLAMTAVAALACSACVLAPGPARAAGAARFVRIGAAPVLPPGTQPEAAAASATQRLRVTVALTPRSPAALSAYANAVADPSSPDYHEYLSTREFVARFGPTTQTIGAVVGALDREGLRVDGLAADHLSVDLEAEPGTLERALHLQLAHVRLPDRTSALVNIEAPALPSAIAGDVQAVLGLDGMQSMRSLRSREPAATAASPSQTRTEAATTAPTATAPTATAPTTTAGSATAPAPREVKHQPTACAAAGSAAAGGDAYTANQIAAAYDFDSLYDAGDEGAGQTIGVYELEPNLPSDIAAYQSCYGTDASVTYSQVDGGAGSGAGSGEAAFDIEQVIGLAPRANLIVYQGPNSGSDAPGSGPYDIFATMISQDKVSVITNSWGECEAVEGAADAHAENTLFEEAAVQGQTIVAAAGDDGSEDCYGATSVPDEALAVDDPGSQPFVTDVGGTSMTAPGPPPTEVVWNGGGNGLATFGGGAGAGGGGISALWAMPSYQATAPASLAVINAESSGSPCAAASGDCREVPDVSADADPAHGYLIYYNGNSSVPGEPAGWQTSGGTSGAAPLWAALFALSDADGACDDQPIGFANPALYRLAATTEGSDFHDITSGDNDFTGAEHGLYPATPGYDMASGLGTPDGGAIAAGLCADSLRLSAPASKAVFPHQAVDLRVAASDASGVPVTLAVSGLPAGLGFDSATGVISGSAGAVGVHVVTITASDATGGVRSVRFVLDVAARPTVSHLSLGGVAAGHPVLSLRVASGQDETALSALTLTLPAGLSLARGQDIVIRSLTSAQPLARAITGAGRRLQIRLRTPGSPVVLQFRPGALEVSGGLARRAAQRARPRLGLTVVTRDASGLVASLALSATPST